jgi:DnaJ-class molecular chaperone
MSSEKPPDSRGSFERPMTNCTKCGGTGKTSFPGQVREAQCQTCKGKGQVPG